MNGSFTSNPVLEFLYDCRKDRRFGRIARLDRELRYVDLQGRHHVVPAGFLTDGGSIPRFLWAIVGSPFTDVLPAFILHDWYYDRAKDVVDDELRERLRLAADELLAECCAQLGLRGPRHWAIYRGVRWFGGMALAIIEVRGAR